MAGTVHEWREPATRALLAPVRVHHWYSRVRKFPAEPKHYLRWKRSFDVAVAFVLLPVILPLLALCCVVIVVDSPGYPIFTQLRTGTCGRRFRMFKLRTMVRDAEAHKDRLGNLNELTWPDFKITDDFMLYVTSSKAFRSGTFSVPAPVCNNAGPVCTTFHRRPQPALVPPETLLNDEIGFRSEWLDGRLRFNATYYEMEFTNRQGAAAVASQLQTTHS